MVAETTVQKTDAGSIPGAVEFRCFLYFKRVCLLRDTTNISLWGAYLAIIKQVVKDCGYSR